VVCSDPGLSRAVDQVVYGDQNVLVRMPAMLVGPGADAAAQVSAHVALVGVAMAGGTPTLAAMDDETLRVHLVDAMRRLLGRPRRRD
jgi:hypothetical protein